MGRGTRAASGQVALCREEESVLGILKKEYPSYRDLREHIALLNNWILFNERDRKKIARLLSSSDKLRTLLPEIDPHGEDNTFLDEYRLLLAKELLKSDPSLRKHIADFLKDRQSALGASLGKDEAARTIRAAQVALEIIFSTKETSEDYLQEGRSSGLNVSFPGEPFSPGSLRVQEEELLLYGDHVISNLPKGIGKNYFQEASAEDLFRIIDKIKMVEKDLDLESIDAAIDKAFESCAPGPAMSALWEADLLDKETEKLGDLGDKLSQDSSLEHICLARLQLSGRLALYGDLRDSLAASISAIKEGISQSFASEKEALGNVLDALRAQHTLLQTNLQETLHTRASEGRRTLSLYCTEPPEEIGASRAIQFQDFHDALSSLNRSKSLNSAALWVHLSERWTSEDCDDWRRAAVEMPTESLEKTTRMIYGSLLVDRDDDLAKKFQLSYDEEEELRLRASLRGKIPEDPLVYMPGPEWVGGEGEAGLYQKSQRDRKAGGVSFVFVKGSSNQARRKTTVHELIHSGQNFSETELPAGMDVKEGQESLRLINEALTETLAQIRTDPAFASNITKSALDDNCSYRPYVDTLLHLLDKAEIKQSDRENLIEDLNAMSTKERLNAFIRLEGKESDPLATWKELLEEHLERDSG